MVHLSRAMREIAPYPFEELDRRAAAARAQGRELVDLGVGDPRDATPAFIRQALAEAVQPVSSYPRAAGLPELRAAVGAWVARRYGVELDPDRHVLPILGSKELVFSLAQLVVDPAAGRDVVVVTAPGYPIPERGARWAGAEVVRLPLLGERGFLPDLHAVPEATWTRTALLWLNYPNNPTGATAPPELYADAAALARHYGFLLASDEAYGELWFEGGPPGSALQQPDFAHVVALHTLSKRSSMTGYRSGFVAGDPDVIAALKRLRPAVGVTPQEFVQRASIAAWEDETHVAEARARYAAKRSLFLELFSRTGIQVGGSAGTFYLWVRTPGNRPSLDWALDLLDTCDVVVAPGSFFGPEGEGYVRMAMVPSLQDCRVAARRIGDVLAAGAIA